MAFVQPDYTIFNAFCDFCVVCNLVNILLPIVNYDSGVIIVQLFRRRWSHNLTTQSIQKNCLLTFVQPDLTILLRLSVTVVWDPASFISRWRCWGFTVMRVSTRPQNSSRDFKASFRNFLVKEGTRKPVLNALNQFHPFLFSALFNQLNARSHFIIFWC